jgi:hypothetical protein
MAESARTRNCGARPFSHGLDPLESLGNVRFQAATTATVWTRYHFQIVAVGVGKVDPASAVVMIDLARAATCRVGPVLETLFADAAKDGIEIDLGIRKA